MSESVAYSIVCPTIIGREAQRTALVQLLNRSQNERGQSALVAGEAGIGKSRLVAEITQHATQQGVRIIAGRSFETDNAIPCALLADLLRSLLTIHPATDLLQELGPNAAELVKVLPELHTQFPATAPHPFSTSEPDKRRLFETLLYCFVTPALPTLIIVEDVHWSDNTSLDFLFFLARKIVAYPILLLITYRNHETSAPLARLLAALDRERLAVEMQLSPLTKLQTEMMLRAIFNLSRPVQEDFLDALHSLTEGNPFFIEEVLKSCVATGDIFQIGGQWGRKLLSEIHIPRTVQVAVNQRVEQLSAAAQQLLKVAAVIGQRFDFTLLQQVSLQDERMILDLLKELMSAQLIIEESEDRFAFRHALTRQAVYFTLLARERRNLHRVVAETIEQQPAAATRLAELAHHFYIAREWRKVWAYARRAGEQAQLLYAPRATVEHFSHALEAARNLSEQQSRDGNEYDSAPLFHARGQAYETLGEFEAAQSDFEQTLALARERDDHKAEWQSLLNLGFLWTSRDFGRAERYYQEALAVARALNEPALLAQSLNRMGNWYVNNEQPRLGERYHDEALAIFQRLNDQAGLAATLDLLAGATLLASDPHRSFHYYQQATALFRQLNQQRGLISCLSWLVHRGPIAISLLTPFATLSQGIASAKDALHLAREIQWRPGEAFAMIVLSFGLGARGDYGEALSLVEEAIALATEIDHRWDTVGYIALGALYVDLGIPTLAQKILQHGSAMAEGHHIRFSYCMINMLLAASYMLQGQIERAKATLDMAFGDETYLASDRPELTLAQRLGWLVRADIALHEGRATDALRIADQLLATTGDSEASIDRAVVRLLIMRGDALFAQRRMVEAEQTYFHAQQAATFQGTRPMLWRIHQRLGQFYKEQGDRGAATLHFGVAREVIDTLAATLSDLQVRGQFLSYALAQLPTPPPLTTLRARKQSVDGLTAREYEIALLIQQGKSDREIADALTLSKRTVSTHVSNILTKLDFGSRTQIAAWAATKEVP